MSILRHWWFSCLPDIVHTFIPFGRPPSCRHGMTCFLLIWHLVLEQWSLTISWTWTAISRPWADFKIWVIIEEDLYLLNWKNHNFHNIIYHDIHHNQPDHNISLFISCTVTAQVTFHFILKVCGEKSTTITITSWKYLNHFRDNAHNIISWVGIMSRKRRILINRMIL